MAGPSPGSSRRATWRILLELACRFAGGAPPSRGLPRERAGAFLAALEIAVPPSVRTAPRELARPAADELAATDPRALAAALRRTANRVALLRCGDPGAALDALVRADVHLAGAPPGASAGARVADLRDVALFALSDPFLELRLAALGMIAVRRSLLAALVLAAACSRDGEEACPGEPVGSFGLEVSAPEGSVPSAAPPRRPRRSRPRASWRGSRRGSPPSRPRRGPRRRRSAWADARRPTTARARRTGPTRSTRAPASRCSIDAARTAPCP